MKKYFFSTAIAFLIFFSICAASDVQRANNWYFGINAGVSFSDMTPAALSNGMMNQLEGCAAISDKAGNLLFYTDGVTIWNRFHDTLSNGSNLLGHHSSSQSALIIPKPCHEELYYVFTTDASSGLNNDASYSLVDMSLDGGKGAVVSKNKILMKNASEKMTAVHHVNKQDIWLLLHSLDSDTFYAFLVSKDTIASPVLSKSGSVQIAEAGCMKFAPDGKKVALAHKDYFEIFDFDNDTGIVSNSIKTESKYPWTYGVEFSPDGSKLYGTMYQGVGDSIIQFDLEAGSDSGIINSAMTIGASPFGISPRSLQLGPDGKIYIAMATGTHLGVINNPNLKSSLCEYEPEGLYLGGRRSRMGLPGFVQSFFWGDSIQIPAIVYDNSCLGDTTRFYLKGVAEDQVDFLWSFGDTTSEVNHVFEEVGSFDINLFIFNHDSICNGIQVDTLFADINVFPSPNIYLPDSLFFCSDSSITIIVNSEMKSYAWSTGSTTNEVIIDAEQTISLEVLDSNGCDNKVTSVVSQLDCTAENPIDYLPFIPNAVSINNFKELIFINQLQDFSESYSFKMFDRFGKVIWGINNTSHDNIMLVEGALSSGVYLYTFKVQQYSKSGTITVL